MRITPPGGGVGGGRGRFQTGLGVYLAHLIFQLPNRKFCPDPPLEALLGHFLKGKHTQNGKNMHTFAQRPNTAFWAHPTFFLRKVAGIEYFFELKGYFGRKLFFRLLFGPGRQPSF